MDGRKNRKMNHKDNLSKIVSDKAKLFGTTTKNLKSGTMGKAEAQALVTITKLSQAGLTSGEMLEKHLGIPADRVKQAERIMKRAGRKRLQNNREI